jgi:hypothetical protein
MARQWAAVQNRIERLADRRHPHPAMKRSPSDSQRRRTPTENTSFARSGPTGTSTRGAPSSRDLMQRRSKETSRMSTYSRAAGRARLRAVPPDNQSVPAIDPVRAIDPMHAMHSALGDVRDEEVLVIGPHGLETMCDLLHRGARSVMLLRMDVRPDAQSASLVVVPDAPSIEWLACVLGHARRALLPAGRIVLRVALVGRQMAAQISRMLRVHGYTAIATRELGDQLLLRAERPGFGRQLHA